MARLHRTALSLVALVAMAPCVREPHRGAAGPVASSRLDASSGDARASADARDAAPADALTDAPVSAPAPLSAAIEAARREDWAAAHAALAALAPEQRSTREARYLAARVALKRGEGRAALAALAGLAAEFAATPTLAAHVERLNARALFDNGRFEEARAAYEALAARTRSASDRAQATLADARLRAYDRAAPAVLAWLTEPPSGVDRAHAWRVAAEVLEATGDLENAARAHRRVAVDEPDHRNAEASLAALTRLRAPLTSADALARAAQLNSRARYAEAIALLEGLAGLTGALEAQRLHHLGRAYYGARNRYEDAQRTLLAAAAAAENPDRDEDFFLSARALARADRDEEAVVAFDRVARELRGRWSDEAAYRAAWLVASLGRTNEAIERYRALLRDRPSAREETRAESAWQLGWLLLRAERFAEADVALAQSAALAGRSLEKGRGRYWSAVAKLRGGAVDDAVAALRALIAERPLTYYALLSEARLRERGLAVDPPRAPAAPREGVTAPLPEGVRWLHALGFDRDAAAMLGQHEDAVRRAARDRADEALAQAYVSMGEAHRAYTLAQRHGDALDREPGDDARWVWDAAYPRPHAAWVEAAEQANGLPRHYLYAIMRQESTFNPRDVSSARAIGLLQMIPPTTRRVAQALGLEFREELLFEPEYNIRTGGHYIGRLFAQYRGVLPRAIGAFNAGPGAMGRWVNRWPDAELDTFVESIPFDETRTYVRRVLQNLARYRYLHGPRDAQWPLRVSLDAHAPVDALVDY